MKLKIISSELYDPQKILELAIHVNVLTGLKIENALFQFLYFKEFDSNHQLSVIDRIG